MSSVKVFKTFYMQKSITLLFLIIAACVTMQAQEKGTTKIMVSGVTFREVTNQLLDFGYSFDKIDSNYQTVKTEYKTFKSKGVDMDICFFVRLKDSTAIISGKWVPTALIGSKLLGAEITRDNSTYDIDNKMGSKAQFAEMTRFAKSFGKEVTYSK